MGEATTRGAPGEGQRVGCQLGMTVGFVNATCARDGRVYILVHLKRRGRG